MQLLSQADFFDLKITAGKRYAPFNTKVIQHLP
jgi:hypothetical protein